MKIQINRRGAIGSIVGAALGASQVFAADAAKAVNFVDTGGQKPTLLFVHGYSCSLQNWAPQMQALAATHRCVALDLPGHGKTTGPATATIASLAGAVTALIDKLAHEKQNSLRADFKPPLSLA